MTSDHQPLGCVKAATTILGDKWTPQLLSVLASYEATRFCQIQDEVGGINPRTLSSRLAALEKHQIVKKLPTGTTNRCEYVLTDKGRDLLPILHSMASWGEKYPPIKDSDLSKTAALE